VGFTGPCPLALSTTVGQNETGVDRNRGARCCRRWAESASAGTASRRASPSGEGGSGGLGQPRPD
jgi:hypothetical protein